MSATDCRKGIIYSDSVSGKLYDQIFTHKPTSLQSLDLENGETLLAFIENKKFVQIYEYKDTAYNTVETKKYQMNNGQNPGSHGRKNNKL
ncbi:hypothetical protein D910_03152 [Dendroctonus ponderosae]|uniref:Uncharacterized protein n=1 Tax=Dendroctonus ponderosae TaxID=77166 RepID=U4TY44_DENPD|nr:hypothetical protein D910_03152 [Dendroctonus ponderosae]